MVKLETLDVGVILERRDVDHQWLDHEWVGVAIVPGPPAVADWTLLEEGENWKRYHACIDTLELHRKETEAYVHNLQSRVPKVYVVMRDNEDGAMDAATPGVGMHVSLTTVSPYDAQDYMDSGEETVVSITMPEMIVAWIENFLSQHHKDEKFRKRRRDSVSMEEHKFGQEPLHELRRRMPTTGDDIDG